jgi:hypothetical protein
MKNNTNNFMAQLIGTDKAGNPLSLTIPFIKRRHIGIVKEYDMKSRIQHNFGGEMRFKYIMGEIVGIIIALIIIIVIWLTLI